MVDMRVDPTRCYLSNQIGGCTAEGVHEKVRKNARTVFLRRVLLGGRGRQDRHAVGHLGHGRLTGIAANSATMTAVEDYDLVAGPGFVGVGHDVGKSQAVIARFRIAGAQIAAVDSMYPCPAK
ncbi:hypothetical protein AJ87_07460 [Rhizobium yanglingense]|nr:hypothetical protein AJ87_07460 [Rhizobium yanglingense]